jgi:tRNA A37 N6-isopentenylltransferase MiaA
MIEQLLRIRRLRNAHARSVIMPEPLILKYREFLQFLAKLDKKKRKQIYKTLDKGRIDCLSEICFNILKKGSGIKQHTLKVLKKYKNEIRGLAKKKQPLKEKRKILSSQRGGFLMTALLPLAASLISSLIAAGTS